MRGERHLKPIVLPKRPPSSNLYVGVAQQLKSLIVQKRLRPGQRIPSERVLAQQLDVTRPVIRDALRVLETLGMIQVVPRQGSFVLDPSLEPYLRSMGESLGATLDGDKGLLSLCEARRILEGEIAFLAAQRATEEDLLRMRAALGRMEASQGEAARFSEADRDFQAAMAAAADNPVLHRIREGLCQLLQKGLAKATRLPGQMEEALQHYRQLLQALERREAAGARREMLQHLEGLTGSLLEVLGGQGS